MHWDLNVLVEAVLYDAQNEQLESAAFERRGLSHSLMATELAWETYLRDKQHQRVKFSPLRRSIPSTNMEKKKRKKKEKKEKKKGRNIFLLYFVFNSLLFARAKSFSIRSTWDPWTDTRGLVEVVCISEKSKGHLSRKVGLREQQRTGPRELSLSVWKKLNGWSGGREKKQSQEWINWWEILKKVLSFRGVGLARYMGGKLLCRNVRKAGIY